jgi:hypothetical protein
MGVRLCDVAAVLMLATCACAYTSVDLKNILKSRNTHKRLNMDGGKGNPCPEPERPFPCKGSATCIPMGFVCDDNWDCEDGYDEDLEVCTAVHRPPVEDIMYFLESEKRWILPAIFGDKKIQRIAHGLAVSQSVKDFQTRLGLTDQQVEALREALKAVKHNDEITLEMLGMPASAWQEVHFVFSKLIKSGFE